MSPKLHLVTEGLIALTLLFCGLYAGLALMCQIALLPAMRKVSLQTYAEVWRVLDVLMDRAMPPFKLTLLVLTAATAGCLFYAHSIPLAAAFLISFVCSLIALILTITKQVPVIHRLRNLPQDADDSTLLEIREQTASNFAVRLCFALVSFAALCVGVAHWPLG